MNLNSAISNIPQAKIPELGASVSSEDKSRMKEAAEGFEEFFLFQVLELMVPESDEKSLFGNNFATEMYNKQANEQTAKSIAKAGGIGMADTIYREMIRQQEMK